MTLMLEIEYLTGVAFAAQGPDSDFPDWPPQPDRVFSALVATWGARGEQDGEAIALKWLEKQVVPTIAASKAEPRTAPAVYVPPNDCETTKGKSLPKLNSKQFKNALGVIPSFRARKERIFPASRPDDPVVRFYWEGASPDKDIFEALDRLASDMSYVGHSASLTRCRFMLCKTFSTEESQSPRRRIYPGRFDELRRDYRRFLDSSGKVGRPLPGDRVAPKPRTADTTHRSYFSTEWLVLEHTGGEMPDIRAAALLAKEIRDTLLSGYRQCGIEHCIPPVVSGHDEAGGPVQAPHLAIIPLAFAGYPYADGHVLGFALVPPREGELLKNREFLQVMRKIAPRSREEERRELHLHNFGLRLSPTLTPSKRSLDSAEYTKRTSTFATVTPIVLDRHLKNDGPERQTEIVDQLKSSCKNIGLPEPKIVVPDKHSAIEGAPSAQPSGRAPGWMRWRLPVSLNSRFLTHAVIQFPYPVGGPVILGAGRFVGLGMCRPLETTE
jgi:CRISPR-associated protein Csb2